jgi:hypothetical protein
VANAAELVEQLKAALEDALKALVFEICANLTETTPVATGFARANWIPSIGEPIEGTDGEHPSTRKGAVVTVSVSLQQAGIAEVLSYTLDLGDLFVSNNVDYIGVLNLGHSTQAPSGFIEASVQKAHDDVNARYAAQGISIEVATNFAAQAADRITEAT